MAKKSDKQAQKRRQAKRLRQRQKRKAKNLGSITSRKATMTSTAQWLRSLPSSERNKFLNWEQSEYRWWLAHGANFLVSDYENGEWNPIFDIYAGQDAPTPQQMLSKIYDVFGPEDRNGLASAAWIVLDSPVIYGYTREIIKQAGKKVDMPEVEVKKPYNGILWEYLTDQIKAKV